MSLRIEVRGDLTSMEPNFFRMLFSIKNQKFMMENSILKKFGSVDVKITPTSVLKMGKQGLKCFLNQERRNNTPFKDSLAFMQQFKFVNWWIGEFVVLFFDVTNRLKSRRHLYFRKKILAYNSQPLKTVQLFQPIAKYRKHRYLRIEIKKQFYPSVWGEGISCFLAVLQTTNCFCHWK